jgi:hypothetical protein
MQWRISIYNEAGEEYPEMRKEIDLEGDYNETMEEAEREAIEWQHKCYKTHGDVDWYELDPMW